MKVRLGLVLATFALFTGTGCGGGGGQSAPSAPGLPGGEELEEGTPPRDNSHTRSADLFLTQAQTTTDEAEVQTRFQAALEAAQEGIAAEPDNPKSYFQAAQALVGLGEYDEAAIMFDKAEEIHPRYILETEPWREQGWVGAYNDAIVPMNNGDLETAAVLFEQANDLYDDRPEAFLQLGSIYSQLDRMDEAINSFRTALDILEETEEIQMADTAAAPIWEQHYEVATTGLGQILTYAERYQEAADFYGNLLEENPDDVMILGNLANALSQLEMPDSVQALYDQLLSRDDLGERELFNAGVGLYQIENYDQAAQAFRRAAEMNPFNRDARLNLAQTLSIAERFEELIPVARELLEVDPRNALGWIFLARALSETDQEEEANEVFNEYQEIGYEVADLRLTPFPEGGTSITGAVKNNSLEPGTPVILRFHFGGYDGEEIGTLDVQVQAPEVEMSEVFQGDFSSDQVVSGYYYEVIAP